MPSSPHPADARGADFVVAGQRVAKGDPLIEFERAPFDAAARAPPPRWRTPNARTRAPYDWFSGRARAEGQWQAAADLAAAQAQRSPRVVRELARCAPRSAASSPA